MSSIRIKAKERNGSVDVKTLMKHNMETGLRKGKDGKKIPEHWITDVTAESGGKVVFAAAFNTRSLRTPISPLNSPARKGTP